MIVLLLILALVLLVIYTTHEIYKLKKLKRLYITAVSISLCVFIMVVSMSYVVSIKKGNVFEEYKEVFGEGLPVYYILTPNIAWTEIDDKMLNVVWEGARKNWGDEESRPHNIDEQGTPRMKYLIKYYNYLIENYDYYNYDMEERDIGIEWTVRQACLVYGSTKYITDALMFDLVTLVFCYLSIYYMVVITIYRLIDKKEKLRKLKFLLEMVSNIIKT